MTPATSLTFDGITQSVAEWALDYGIAPAVIIGRLERGLSVEQAITTRMVTAPGQRLTGKHLDSYIAAHARRPRKRQHERRAYGRRYSFDGKTMTLRGWAEHIGISHNTLQKRFALGWTLEQALTTPKQRRAGVVSNFETLRGTGAGSTAQEIPEITFSEQAENA